MRRHCSMFALIVCLASLLHAQSASSWPQSWTGGGGSDQPKAVDVDTNGNVYVGGYTTSFESTGEDVLLLKFDSTGSTAQSFASTWGPFVPPYANAAVEQANDLRIGPDNNIYVVASGLNPAVLKYDLNGNPQWQVSAAVPGISNLASLSFDSAQNIVVGAGGNVAVPLRFGSDGSLLPSQLLGWAVAGMNHQTASITIDAFGNVVIAGTLYDYTAQVMHPFVVKYNSQGTFLWGKVWVSSTGLDYVSNSRVLTTDPQGNIYLAGSHTAQGTIGTTTLVVAPLLLRINADGSFGWAKTWDVSQFGSLGFGSAHISTDGNVLVGGGGGSPHVSINGEIAPTSGILIQAYTRTGTLGSGASVITQGAVIDVASASSNTSAYTAVTLNSSDLPGQLTTPAYNPVPVSGTSTQLGTRGTWAVTSRTGVWNPSLPLTNGNLVLVSQIPTSLFSQSAPLSTAPTNVPFPNTNVGANSSAQVVVLKNVSGSPVTVGSATVSSNFYITNNTCGASIAVNASCRISVQFRPTVPGPLKGVLTVNETTPAFSQAVLLSGTGVALLNITPSTLAFAPTPLPTTTTQIVTLSNTSGAAVSLTASITTAQFKISSNTCGASLASGAACTLTLSFTPAGVVSYTGVLTINETIPKGSQTLVLTGDGISGGIVASPTALSFADTTIGATSAAQQVIVTNYTGSAVTVGSVATTGDFAVSNNACSAALAAKAGSHCSVTVRFHPSSAGGEIGTLTIGESSLAASQSVTLSGSGLNPVPRIGSISPTKGLASGPGFVITVNGSSFVADSTIQWNGMNRVTTLVSTGQLTAQILPSDIGAQNTAYVTVSSPSPGGGTSNSKPFTIQSWNWTKLSGPWSASCDGSFGTIALTPDNSGAIYVGSSAETGGCGIFKSTNRGATWAAVNNGLPRSGALLQSYEAISVLAIAASNPAVLYAGTFDSTSMGQTGQVLTSSDGGASWQDASGTPIGLLGISRQIHDPVLGLAIDSHNPQRGFASVVGDGVFSTTDGGSSWNNISPGTNTASVMSYPTTVRLAPSNSSSVYLTGFTSIDADFPLCVADESDATNDDILLADCLGVAGITPMVPTTSTNSGSNWTALSWPANDPPAFVSDLAVDPTDSSVVYAATDSYLVSIASLPYFGGNRGVFRSFDGGATWSAINGSGPVDLSQYPFTGIMVDPNTPTSLYAVAGFSGVFSSQDSGTTWWPLPATGLPESTYVSAIGIGSNVIYALTSNGVYRLAKP